METPQIELLQMQVELLREQNAQLMAIVGKFAEWKPQPINIANYIQSCNSTANTSEGAKVTSKQDASNVHTQPQNVDFHTINNAPKC